MRTIQLSELMKINVKTLAENQKEALKEHAISILEDTISNLKLENYDAIKTFFSAAGDGMGDDNTCLDFSYSPGTTLDIHDVIEILRSLEKVQL